MERKMENGVVKMNAGVFIIPNSAGKFGDFLCGKESKKQFLNELIGLNDAKYDIENDYLIQVWFFEQHDKDDDDYCDNLCRHSFSVIDENGDRWYTSLFEENIPEGFFNGHKEGDHINIKFPTSATKRGDDDKESINIIVDMDVELNQLDYRYRNFGPFEEVLRKVKR